MDMFQKGIIEVRLMTEFSLGHVKFEEGPNLEMSRWRLKYV